MTQKVQSESEAAHKFRAIYGDQIRFVPEQQKWLIKDHDHWNFDEAKGIEALVRFFLDSEVADPRWKGSWSVVRSVKGICESDASLHVATSMIDAREYLLGTATQVYDLKKRKAITTRAGTYVTKRTSVDPDFVSDCPRWKKFIRQIFKKDKEKIAYFQRFCGYLLTGSVKEQRMLVIYGPGGNGKSVLINTIAKIMGDYHREALPETFVEGKSIKHETAMAFIAGARFVTSGETEQSGTLNEPTVKRATGADMVSARFLYKNPFTYRPTYKIWVTTNHLPRLKSVGPDIRRRIHLLELDFIPKSPDHDLEEKLREEHPAILAWMMEGTSDWIDQKLNPPSAITGPTEQYFAEQDTLGTWIIEHTREIGGAKTPSAVLCDSYNRFLRARGLPEVDGSLFGRHLSARGFESKLAKVHKDASRARCFFGIRLR